MAEEKKAVDGQDIYTTLDSRLQNTLEDLMTQVNEKYEPVSMTAMLMEAKTGEIVAMSQRPTFNPETKQGLDDNGTWQNLLVESPYEPYQQSNYLQQLLLWNKDSLILMNYSIVLVEFRLGM